MPVTEGRISGAGISRDGVRVFNRVICAGGLHDSQNRDRAGALLPIKSNGKFVRGDDGDERVPTGGRSIIGTDGV